MIKRRVFMKKVKLLLIATIMVIGCSKNTSTNVSEPTQNVKGSVGLYFQKSTTPDGVKSIKVFLNREGYSSIEKTYILLSDSSEEILIENIVIGIWKLKIDATDANGQVLYTGQAEVSVVEGMVTQINLMLQPVNTGMGGIKINVTWGNAQNNWIDYGNNPVLKKQGTKYDGRGVGYPIIFKDDSVYRMYYLNIQSQPDTNGAISSVGLATSIDGNNWKKYSQEPVLKPTKNSWDAAIVVSGQVLKDGNIYKMFYEGTSVAGGSFKIGLATSLDGIHWEKRSDPVFQGTAGWESSIGVWGVLKVNSAYYMYYHSAFPNNIGLAISSDGINWTRYPGNPIIIPSQNWESSGISMASVLFDNGLFKMVYLNGDYSASFGYATSKDGIIWTKDLLNPIFSKAKTLNNWTPGTISYSFLTKIGSQERIYYTGNNSANNEMSIGYAYKE